MMLLRSIQIERFRGIRSGEVKGLTDVNLLIGRNNSGKSTLAEAISHVFWELVGHDEKGRLRVRGTSDSIFKPLPEQWAKIRKSAAYPDLDSFYQRKGPVNLMAGFSMPSGNEGYYGVTYVSPGKSLQSDSEDVRLRSEVRDFASEIGMFRSTDGLNDAIEKGVWESLLSDRRDKVLVQEVNEIFQMQIEHMQLPPSGKCMLLFPDISLPLDVQGDGARTALRCLMILAMLQSTLFILEEPECHQHPGSLERFALAICRLAKKQEVQLLISTHSIECVRKFLAAGEEVGSETSVFHLSLEDGQLESTRLAPEAVETLQDTGVDVRFLDIYG